MIRNPKKARVRVDLPRVTPEGRRTDLHPLAWLVKHRMPEECSKADAARAAGVDVHSFYIMLRQADDDPRHYPVPSIRARKLARFFSVRPAYLRPDVFHESWEEPTRRDLL